MCVICPGRAIYFLSCHLAPIGPGGPKLSTMHTACRRPLLLESQPTSFGLILQEEEEEEQEKEKKDSVGQQLVTFGRLGWGT